MRWFQPKVRALLLLAFLLGVAVLAAMAWRFAMPESEMRPAPQIVMERLLNYSITLQKNPDAYPGSNPFLLSSETVFEAGDQVRLNVSSPQHGYLYVINEGPATQNGLPDYVVMFPDTMTKGGSAEVKANQAIQIPQPSRDPEQDWFVFDKEEGIERVWLVWSAQSVPELEAVKGRANPRDQGRINEPSQIKSVAQFLAAHSTSEPKMEKDEITKQTKLKSSDELLIGLVKLEHKKSH